MKNQKAKPPKTIKLRINAVAGWCHRKHVVEVFVGKKNRVAIHEREWPGAWPPKVGDIMTLTVTDEGNQS